MLAATADETGVLLAVNVVLCVPAGTVTVAGTVIAGLSLVRLIAAPPAGARPLRNTITLTGYPAIVAPVDAAKPPNKGPMTIVFCKVRAPAVAVRMMACVPVTAVVVMGKL